MRQNELVSIITPSYNTEKYIIDTIKSVQAQTYRNWEMLIVDDCSTDRTITVVEDYLENTGEGRVRLLSNRKNSGAAVSRNYALREAKGKWIAFLDSDDLWVPQKLEKQISFMRDNNCHFSYTKYEEMDKDGKALGVIVSGPKKITKRGMYNYCWPGCLTVMYDAETVGLIQIVPIEKNNDYAMWLKICKKSECRLLDESLAYYRKRTGSISNVDFRHLIIWHYFLWKKVMGFSGILAFLCTVRNIVWGVIKKIFYKRSKRL